MNTTELLKSTKVEVAPETFFLISLRHEDWLKLLENPELSPRGTAPFMLLRDPYEVTLLLEEVDYRTIRHAVRDAKTEGAFRLLTFNIELDWNVIGFLAEISRILADAGVPVGAISSFTRDHLLIKQEHLANALKALGNHIAELC